jgi:ABC-type Fe3+/spermidine/putrescine transport system ATPase subunit
MQDELKAIQRRVGATFVHVTHDQEEAMAIADRVVVMNKGVIEDQGPPERVYRRPATRFVAAFLGDTNFVPATVRGGQLDTALGPMGPSDQPEGTRLTVCLRPEHIGPGHGLPGPCTVTETVFQGVHRRVRVVPACAPALNLMALLPVGMDAAPGDTLSLTVDLTHITTLPEDQP